VGGFNLNIEPKIKDLKITIFLVIYQQKDSWWGQVDSRIYLEMKVTTYNSQDYYIGKVICIYFKKAKNAYSSLVCQSTGRPYNNHGYVFNFRSFNSQQQRKERHWSVMPGFRFVYASFRRRKIKGK